MSQQSRWEYIQLVRQRYQNADKKLKAEILNELCRNLNLHRKSAVRLINQKQVVRPLGGRRPLYSDIAKYHVKKLWLNMNQMCGRKLKCAIREWLPHYATRWDLSEAIQAEIRQMSASTLERVLQKARSQHRRRRMTGTTPFRAVRNIIPIKPLDWNVTEAGHMEADTVAHCGGSMSGVFVWSLTVTDIKLTWTEVRAMWGKSGFGVSNAMEEIERVLPSPIQSLSVDNGNEFLNHQLILNFSDETKRMKKIPILRGRPYKKNDQCHVEQKNHTHVRELFGYERYGDKVLVELMNDLYANEWSSLQNLWIPTFKMIRKTRVGAKYQREYGEPKTAYDRVMESKEVSLEVKEKLTELKKSQNPFQLMTSIQTKLARINKLREHAERNIG